MVFKLYIRSSDRLLADRDRYIARLEAQNDELVGLATRGAKAAEKATETTRTIVSSADVAEELTRLRQAILGDEA